MESIKNIIHVWQSHYPWEVRVGKINRALQSQGTKVHVLCRHRENEAECETQNGVYIYRVGHGLPRALSLPVPGNLLWKIALDKLIDKVNADAILVRDIPLAGLAAALGSAKKIPVILDMAEHYPEAMRSWKKYSENYFLRKLVHDWKLPDKLEARVVKRMQGILVVCEEQKNRLAKDYKYPAEKICVVLNTPEMKAEVAKSFEANREKPFYFGYHGILCEDRELEVVLQGFSLAAMDAPELRLLIAGGGESEEKLRALAKDLPAKDKIRFTGRYQPDQLKELYQEVDFGIVSLRDNIFTQHTVANKFFDYPSMGKPFIFTGIRPLLNLMEQMNCAISFVPGSPESVADAIKKIRDQNYAALAQNGYRSIVSQFNWALDSQRLLQFFRSL